MMSGILEIVMLACFGLSWPVSLVKNLRAKSAKSTSLAFMSLILFGYLAGITAKVMTAGFNYVFYVYLFNIAMVVANLAVTLLNRHREHRAGNAQNAMAACHTPTPPLAKAKSAA
ncbi:MAG: hypothetical protein IJC99_00345 [Clostridia bacterium]|nr:hypothetical protein [Clostridia bacterium]